MGPRELAFAAAAGGLPFAPAFVAARGQGERRGPCPGERRSPLVQAPGASFSHDGRHDLRCGPCGAGISGFDLATRPRHFLGQLMTKLLCVYCASSDRLDDKYYQAATALGCEMVARGWGLVYGGGRTGMMGCVARAVKQRGGKVVGVIPEFMKLKELAYAEADELVTVITMRERKLLMETRADAFVALPGGWGTLEEILEILTLRQLEVVQKPCVLLNQDGFYDDLLRLFDRMLADKFFKPSNLSLVRVAKDVPDIFAQLARPEPQLPESKWFETR